MNFMEKIIKNARIDLLGRTITSVRYMNDSEANQRMWDSKPLIIELDTDYIIYPSKDDEGNNGGSIFTGDEVNYTLPTLRVGDKDSIHKTWEEIASKQLLNSGITDVRYLIDTELEGLGWDSSTVVIFLDNGNYFFASSDDEGNEAGSMFTSFERSPVLGSI